MGQAGAIVRYVSMKFRVTVLALLTLLAGCNGVASYYRAVQERAAQIAVARFQGEQAKMPPLFPNPPDDLGPSVATTSDYHPPVYHEVYRNGVHVGSIEDRGDGDIHYESDNEGVTWIHGDTESDHE
jgi:hypothetical protein